MELVLQFLLLYFLARFDAAASQSTVGSLPGYPGFLPFKLETGYIGVGENEQVQLFYYFIQSEGDPERDPLLLWLNGGPGCSALSALVYEIGPLAFDVANFDGRSLPSFTINPYSWTKVASIIFIDSPVGTGFSYSDTPRSYATSDTKSAEDIYTFLIKWLLMHPKFVENRLFVAGDSYGGKIVPMVALLIAKGNEDGIEPKMSLEGYVVGNSVTQGDKDVNERIPYAHRMALISDEYFELARSSCHGEYVNPDPNNVQCLHALDLINKCTDLVNSGHILEPICRDKASGYASRLVLEDDDQVNLLLSSKENQLECRSQSYLTSYVWANNETVQESLGIRKGTIGEWTRCSKSLIYEKDVESVFEHHRLLNEKGFQALAYSGDHDMVIPYTGTLKWIRKLNLSMDEEWRAWIVDGQVAGYTEKYNNSRGNITFATVKGGGHTAPEYKPKECLAMMKRWFSLYTL